LLSDKKLVDAQPASSLGDLNYNHDRFQPERKQISEGQEGLSISCKLASRIKRIIAKDCLNIDIKANLMTTG